MMGSRGGTTGSEVDAFSRRSRRLVRWARGQLKKLKRAFAKRSRRVARGSARSEASEANRSLLLRSDD